MAKKKASNQPIVAEEPARPEEQFHLEESEVAPPSSRPIGARTTVAGSNLKTYSTRSASERRAGSERRPASSSTRRSTTSRRSRSESGPRPEIVNNMLANPTIVVTEDQLRQEYSYVIADLRSMAIIAAALVAALFVLAEVLPK